MTPSEALSTISLAQHQIWTRYRRLSLPKWNPTPEQEQELSAIAERYEALAQEVIENE